MAQEHGKCAGFGPKIGTIINELRRKCMLTDNLSCLKERHQIMTDFNASFEKSFSLKDAVWLANW